MIAGVCAGLAQREGWDPTLIRILAVVCFFGGFGMVLVAYIAGWVIMPNEPVWFAAPPHSTPDASVAAS
jgi:phage shock protein PspC (stress-responsive transcriptional regulator)